MPVDRAPISAVRVGRFSGSGPSLVRALERHMPVRDWDTLSLASKPRMLRHRLMGLIEARAEAKDTPWNKTKAWSKGVQQALIRSKIVSPDQHSIFVQTLIAPVLEERYPYSIYTDRVGREGAAEGGEFRSRFTQKWLAREQDFLLGASHVFVMGPSTKRALVDAYRLPPDRVHVVGAGVNCPLGQPTVSAQCRRFLFIGVDWRRKGLLVLLQAFEMLRRELADAELTVIGGVPPMAAPDGVRFVGRVDPKELDRYYSAADAFVMPTATEAYGIVFAEALSKGIPCIGTSIGNQPWLIGDAGICSEPGEADALLVAMRDLGVNYGSYKLAAERRGHLLREKHTWDAVAARIALQLGSDDPIPDLEL